MSAKGIYDVDAFERALQGRVPENALLSHDSVRGSLRARRPLHRHRADRRLSEPLPDLGRAAAPVGARRLAAAAVARAKGARPRAARASAICCRRSRAGRSPTTCAAACSPPALVLLLLSPAGSSCRAGPSLWTGTAFLVLFFPAYVQWGQTFTNRVRGVRLARPSPSGARQSRVEPAAGAAAQRLSRASVVRDARRDRRTLVPARDQAAPARVGDGGRLGARA